MPVYVNCPHCDHPQVVPVHRRGKTRHCRQCGHAYQTLKTENEVRPMPGHTMRASNSNGPIRKKVYCLDV